MVRSTRREFIGEAACGSFALAAATMPSGWWRGRARVAGVRGELGELVRFVQTVEPARVVAELVERTRAGLTPECLLVALLYAGVSDVRPQPVGFQFHCVLQLPSVWQVARALPVAERLLPLAYALANYQQLNARAPPGGGLPEPPPAGALPTVERAATLLAEACANWDAERGDRAITALARGAPREALIEQLLPWALRNFADVGHHPIFAAGAFQLLDQFGWQHAETLLRSLVQGLLLPGESEASRDYPRSRELAAQIAAQGGVATGDLAELGLGDTARTGERAFDLATLGADASAARGGLLRALVHHSRERQLDAGFALVGDVALELLMENRGLLAVHATTSIRALHELSRRTDSLELRWTALLQAAAWLPRWRAAFGGAKQLPRERSARLSDLVEDSVRVASGVAFESLLADHGGDRRALACRTAAQLAAPGAPSDFIAAARGLLVAKGRESHDWKFFAAVEACGDSPGWHDGTRGAARLAVLVHYLRLPDEPDFTPVAALRTALAR